MCRVLLWSVWLQGSLLLAATYQVGPGKPYASLQEVADLLLPGDVVEVDGDHTYPGDVVFTQTGTEAHRIVIRGLRIHGQRPVISGGANTVQFATPWPYSGPGADFYLFEGFEVTGGASRGIYHQAHDLIIRDVLVRDCPNHGILGADEGSGSLTLEYVEVYGCGSGTQRHQIYMATDETNRPGSVFRMQHCYIHDANGGNNVKTRAERNEIYYNWIEGALYHELEMIGPDGQDPTLAREDSDVVGNVLRTTNDFYLTRCGGDGTGETDGRYRFVNNTFILDSRAAFRLFDGIESMEMHNNIFYRQAGGAVTIIRDVEADWTTGGAVIAGSNNWVLQGASDIPAQWTGTMIGDDPGFLDVSGRDFRLGQDAVCRNAGANTVTSASGFAFPDPHFPPAFLPPLHAIEWPGEATERAMDGWLDIGAFEFASGLSGDLNGDRQFDIRDLIVLWSVLDGLLAPGTPPCVCPLCGDLDQSGELDLGDVPGLTAAWGH